MSIWQRALAMWSTVQHIYSVSLANLTADIQRTGKF